ncbi:MAG: ABC transporter ATP-binding protein [Mesorhizobium sp.]|uniref:ABC transporter ATP-binding protein n=1 Tax=Mesorhizobium sp. TaxID=1871066 RepID=UPI00120A7BE6|nr:ABC transporter ATP-binding protein [Mesorhizobium sp.]TIN95526.1 MAG: ABC transporter ATP-binding protein [Mesorhizobium sp.]TJU97173.1 MAG: ABC transporter ATP-binding protein [Mesorhizobium sp.]
MLLEFDSVSKSYGAVQVLKPISLTVQNGEFLTILGPSGSGKTTILRLAGGFTQPTSGRLRFEGNDISGVPTHRRPFNTLFQDYALFPHMTVAQNVGYGLMLRKEPKAKIGRLVAETLEIVGLAGFLERYPHQLSGGQRQRVALARAIVCEPRLILLDEPLAALDAELRRQMQYFLKALQRRIRTTFLFVTHDQEEATTMSDRIVVMNRGRIEQIGSPTDIYYHPRSNFVAGFFGDNNLVEGKITDGRVIETPLARFQLDDAADFAIDASVIAAIRPEKIRLDGKAHADDVVIPAEISDVIFVGPYTRVVLKPASAPDRTLTAKITSGSGDFRPGQAVELAFRRADIAIVPVSN